MTDEFDIIAVMFLSLVMLRNLFITNFYMLNRLHNSSYNINVQNIERYLLTPNQVKTTKIIGGFFQTSIHIAIKS